MKVLTMSITLKDTILQLEMAQKNLTKYHEAASGNPKYTMSSICAVSYIRHMLIAPLIHRINDLESQIANAEIPEYFRVVPVFDYVHSILHAVNARLSTYSVVVDGPLNDEFFTELSDAIAAQAMSPHFNAMGPQMSFQNAVHMGRRPGEGFKSRHSGWRNS